VFDEQEQDARGEQEEDEDGDGVGGRHVAGGVEPGGRHQQDEGARDRVAPIEPRVDRIGRVGREEDEEDLLVGERHD
jgi:hypothetical protein